MSSYTFFSSFRHSTAAMGFLCLVGSFVLPDSAAAQLRITEAMSSSAGTGFVGTQDWFEVTNYGGAPVDITGWKVDDSSFLSTAALALNGVTSVGPGESVIFCEIPSAVAAGAEAGELVNWRSYWGGTAATAQVGWYRGSGIGLSSSGDGLVLFNGSNAESTPRVSFGAATAGSSFYWAYRADGSFGIGGPTNGVVSTIGTLPGENGGITQNTFLSVDPAPSPFNVTNIGSPGTAAVVPEPSTVALTVAGLGLAGLAARRRLRKA